MSDRQWNVAVLGATGLVGDTMIKVLEERKFPVKQLFPLASNRSLGKDVEFNGKKIPVIDVETFDFAQADIGLFSAGGEVSRLYAPKAAAAGCVVIDNTSEFRYDDDIPLVVPEVNPEAIKQFTQRRIIANPNCSTIQMLVALKPLHDAARIERINVATYQSVSGAGKEAVDELAEQTVALMSGKGPVKPKVVAAQIAFNVVPQIDKFQDNGYTKEEMKMFWETRKIFADPDIKVNATTVRVPVFFGHSEVVNIETARKLTVPEARKLLEAAPGVKVIDTRKPGGYPTAAVEAANDDRVFVGRIREDISHERGLNLWIVSDNIRKGAATNSVQIAEILVREYL
ncbi:MAG: aspartate-semialdehyde dehydrogenase [Gammaproteobacteria bacterium]|jgi:aspartate-semialdehyde dehydrogenase|nr:aspartate-semialdehyde dehydrogenase [Gammaproteobacteria bacterium]